MFVAVKNAGVGVIALAVLNLLIWSGVALSTGYLCVRAVASSALRRIRSGGLHQPTNKVRHLCLKADVCAAIAMVMIPKVIRVFDGTAYICQTLYAIGPFENGRRGYGNIRGLGNRHRHRNSNVVSAAKGYRYFVG